MVQSKAQTVDEWMAALDLAGLPAFQQLRRRCPERLAGWAERMQQGMPGYGLRAADSAVAFNSRKQNIAFCAGPTVIVPIA
ncbi:hypothetical protein [Siccirubricoccus phaeus]|uniref:hypothetical protein n=1 Tax=Siccirubricoccus phaeus TaxID=2595053 RepID=UPI0011F329AD|nr:hypothetical protein [Siccirubricoccus phaeus]